MGSIVSRVVLPSSFGVSIPAKRSTIAGTISPATSMSAFSPKRRPRTISLRVAPLSSIPRSNLARRPDSTTFAMSVSSSAKRALTSSREASRSADSYGIGSTAAYFFWSAMRSSTSAPETSATRRSITS